MSKFEWEKIYEQKEGSVYFFATYRVKVFGGWLVRNFDLTIHPYKGANNLNQSTSESCVFVPDPNYEWQVAND